MPNEEEKLLLEVNGQTIEFLKDVETEITSDEKKALLNTVSLSPSDFSYKLDENVILSSKNLVLTSSNEYNLLLSYVDAGGNISITTIGKGIDLVKKPKKRLKTELGNLTGKDMSKEDMLRELFGYVQYSGTLVPILIIENWGIYSVRDKQDILNLTGDVFVLVED